MSHNFAGTDQDVTWGFVYNPAAQIQSLSSNMGLYDYVQKDKPLESRSYDGLNRDTSVTAVTGGYDTNGNLANEGTGGRAMTYDIDNRLLTLVRSSTGLNATLVYDPMGRLSSYTRNGTVTQFLYDGVNLVGEYDGAGTLLRRYVHGTGVDEPLVWYENISGSMETRFLYANYQGSVIAWTDGAGAMQDYYKYDPYGLPYNNNNTAPTWTGSRFRYTGQTMLDGAELYYYYKARVYDPAYGRFLQTDPIGGEDDLDLYAYVGDDPINETDPTGQCPMCISAAIGFGIGFGLDVAKQTFVDGKKLKDVNYGHAAVEGVIGGVAGATGVGAASLLTKGGLAAGIVAGAVSGGITNGGHAIHDGKSAKKVAVDTAVGVVGGAVGGGVGAKTAQATQKALTRMGPRVAGVAVQVGSAAGPKTAAQVGAASAQIVNAGTKTITNKVCNALDKSCVR